MQYKCNINAIYYACQYGNSEIAKMFIDMCKDPELETING